MADVSISNLVGEKLNSTKYSYWSTCTTSYLKVHDLWGSHGWHINCLTHKARFETSAWNQKAERALYVLKRTVTKEMISHIKDAKSPSQAWNALAILFNQAIDNEAIAIREAARKRSQKAICHVNRSRLRGSKGAVLSVWAAGRRKQVFIGQESTHHTPLLSMTGVLLLFKIVYLVYVFFRDAFPDSLECVFWSECGFLPIIIIKRWFLSHLTIASLQRSKTWLGEACFLSENKVNPSLTLFQSTCFVCEVVRQISESCSVPLEFWTRGENHFRLSSIIGCCAYLSVEAWKRNTYSSVVSWSQASQGF